MRAVTEGETEVVRSFSMPRKISDWLSKAAENHETSRSAIVRAAIKRFAADQNPDKWKEVQ